jgi:hypothetical protein
MNAASFHTLNVTLLIKNIIAALNTPLKSYKITCMFSVANVYQ